MDEIYSSSDRVLDTVPVVVDESQIHPFKVYLCDEIRTGMHYKQELYGLIREVDPWNRLDAYQLGCEMLSQGLPVLMTASRKRYALWVNLRHSSIDHHQLLK